MLLLQFLLSCFYSVPNIVHGWSKCNGYGMTDCIAEIQIILAIRLYSLITVGQEGDITNFYWYNVPNFTFFQTIPAGAAEVLPGIQNKDPRGQKKVQHW